MNSVFVSYSRENSDPVRYIVKYLREKGYPVWLDEDLSAGSEKQFIGDIDHALKTSTAVLVCWSTQAVESLFVQAEALHGLENDKLVQINMDGVVLPTPFNAKQFLDFSEWKGFSNGWVDCVKYGMDDPIEQLFCAISHVLLRRRTSSLKERYSGLIDALAKTILDRIEEVEPRFNGGSVKSHEIASPWSFSEFESYRWEIVGILDALEVTCPKTELQDLDGLASAYLRGDSEAEKLVWHSQQSLPEIIESAKAIAEKADQALKALNKCIQPN